MSDINFWLRCVNSRCVIVPVPMYSQYGADGNTHQEHFLGIRYAALPFYDDAVGPNFYFYIEEGLTGDAHFYATPEDALAAREASKDARSWLAQS